MNYNQKRWNVWQPLIPNPIYKLNLVKPNDHILKTLHEFYSQNKYRPKDILRLLRNNPDCLYGLLTTLPFSYLINIINEYNFLTNYWTKELIDEIVFHSWKRFIVTNSKTELISLNNIVDVRFNFIKIKLPEWLTDNFFIGSALILHHASSIKTNKYLIYSKNRKIKFPADFQIQESRSYYIININSDQYYIPKFYYPNLESVFENTNETIIMENNEIYATSYGYQSMKSLNVEIKEEVKLFSNNSVKVTIVNAKKSNKILCCYNCKRLSYPLYHVSGYESMCVECGLFNQEKKLEMTDLNGITCLVTGIRQKIGKAITLKLLRCGAKVIGTTRFPNASWYNYMQEYDFEQWKDRLIIYKVNFLFLTEVYTFLDSIKSENISIFINNACQTIRASKEYYNKLISFDNNLRLTYPSEYEIVPSKDIKYIAPSELIDINNNIKLNKFGDIQDIDIKYSSSWQANLSDIEPGEIMEVTLINQLVPTLIINTLMNKLIGGFIIQVTALEGSFNIDKNSKHAHTNMCKAAMNMLIRTLKEQGNVNVYSVNPGFVSGVNPNPDINTYPLSPEDGAARILYPIIKYYNNDPLPVDWVHIKNYQSSSW